MMTKTTREPPAAAPRRGMTLVLSGPSGSGKSSLYHAALPKLGGFEFSVSCTTREPREGEVHGKDYFFLSREEFRSRIAGNAFAEYAEVHGNFYGTLKSELDSRMKRGMDVLLDIDVQGARQIRELCAGDPLFADSCEFLFIAPPSFAELERRLRGRGTETEESLARRLANAHGELAKWREYDYVIVNRELEKAVSDFIALVTALRMSTARMGKEPFDA